MFMVCGIYEGHITVISGQKARTMAGISKLHLCSPNHLQKDNLYRSHAQTGMDHICSSHMCMDHMTLK